MIPRSQNRMDAGMTRSENAGVIGLDARSLELEHHALRVEFDDFTGHGRLGTNARYARQGLGDFPDGTVRVRCQGEMDSERGETPGMRAGVHDIV